MTKTRISLHKALDLLKQEKLTADYEIVYLDSERVQATDAIELGALGLDVPDHLIEYNDAELEEDDEFDGEWIPISSDIEDYKKHLTIQLKVDQEVEEWLTHSKVDLDKLVSELITGFYKSSKALAQ